MKGSTLNYVNVGLIGISLLIAFKVPFQLFLFSYAVLGPLHYLTEISWLRKRNFFTTGKKDWLVLLLITIFYIICHFAVLLAGASFYGEEIAAWWGDGFKEAYQLLGKFTILLIFTTLITAIAMAAFRKTLHKIIFVVIGIILGIAASGSQVYTILVSVLLPTLIHVLVFTGAFMLFGALKDRSKSGIFTFVVFAIAACFALFSGYGPVEYFQNIDHSILETYQASSFDQLYQRMMMMLAEKENGELVAGQISLQHGVLRLIAFGYTYHYLNWFSKTSVIGWHKIPKRNLIAVGAIWVASVFLYWLNYQIGLLALLFLSFLHVFLEFPLNYHSFVGIGKEGMGWIRGSGSKADKG